MKGRLSLFVVLASSLNASNALAYTWSCNHHIINQPTSVNPTFHHLTVLSSSEVYIPYAWGGSFDLHANYPSGCDAWGTMPEQPVNPPNNIFHGYISGLVAPECSGYFYSWWMRRIFKAMITYVDPNDPFQNPITIDTLWPWEGFVCEKTGTLSLL